MSKKWMLPQGFETLRDQVMVTLPGGASFGPVHLSRRDDGVVRVYYPGRDQQAFLYENHSPKSRTGLYYAHVVPDCPPRQAGHDVSVNSPLHACWRAAQDLYLDPLVERVVAALEVS